MPEALQALNNLYHRTDWTDVPVRNRQVQQAWSQTSASAEIPQAPIQQAGER